MSTVSIGQTGTAVGPIKTAKAFVHLQTLRAIAASLVVVDHALNVAVKGGALPASVGQLGWHLGYLGVLSFFAISGFIMTQSSLTERGPRYSAIEFLRRRFIRIIPMYWIASALIYARHPTSVFDLLRSLAFIPYGDGVAPMRPVLAQGWTLNYEMLFYAIFAACIALTPRRMALALVGTMVSVVCLGAAFKPLLNTSDPVTLATFWTDPILLVFLAGCMIGVARRKWPTWTTGLPPILTSMVLLGVASIAFSALGQTYPLPFAWKVGYWAICILVVATAIFAPQSEGSVLEIPLERLGDASYSTYLFHWFAMNLVIKVIDPTVGSSPMIVGLYVTTCVIMANALGLGIYFVIERPLTERLRRLTEKRPADPART